MNKELICKKLLISYSEFNNQGGVPAVFFLHGWRSNKEVWGGAIKQVSNLASKQGAAYALDLPGFGQSEIPKAPMAVGDYAEVVNEFINKLELSNVIIVGHSFGGRVGIKLASTHPEVVDKLILVDSAGFAINSSKKTAMGLLAKVARPFFKPSFMQGIRKNIYKQIGAEDYVATPELQKTFLNITSEDLSEDMKNIKCPTLILTGEDDKDTPVEFGQKMHSLIPNSSFLILPNAGHFSFIDQPEKFTAAVQAFIQ